MTSSSAEKRPLSSHVDEDSQARPRTLGGRYELSGYLDSGGTADVFRAIDRENETEVAVKVLNAKSAADERLRRYFLQGARGAQRVRHPNVVRLFAVEEPEAAPPFAVMEVVEGAALSAWLADFASLEVHLALGLALQAARGLDAAHRVGVIHCDVKPENLLVEGSDNDARLKVIDFDLAVVDGELEVHEHPLLRGTAKYMAPEQVVADSVDARTDVYGLGVVLYRMLTGQLPFDLELSATLLWHQLASPVPPLSWLREDIDARLEAIVLRALKKSPDNRYPNMAALIDDLHALSDGKPLFAETPYSLPDAYMPKTESARAAARAIARAV